jgi:hypothetical protein
MSWRYLIIPILFFGLWLMQSQFASGKKLEVQSSLISTPHAHRKPKGLTISASPGAESPPPRSEINDIGYFAQTIREDRFCWSDTTYTSKVLFPEESTRSTNLYKALIFAVGPPARTDSCALALLASNEKSALEFASEDDSVPCRFIQALLFTNQIAFYDAPTAMNYDDHRRGLEILRDLELRYPENGIYSFFRVGALRDTPETFDEAKAEFLSFIKTQKFENPLIPLYEKLQTLGRFNATAALYSSELAATVHIPDYQKATSAIKSIGQDPAYRNQAEDFVLWWHFEMQRITEEKIRDPHLIPVEISALKGLAKSLWEFHFPDEAMPSSLVQENWVTMFRMMFGLDVSPFTMDTVSYDAFNCTQTHQAFQLHFPEYLNLMQY